MFCPKCVQYEQQNMKLNGGCMIQGNSLPNIPKESFTEHLSCDGD